MSRIAGVVHRRGPQQISADLSKLVRPLRHHPSYAQQQTAGEQHALAVLKLSEQNRFGQLAVNFLGRYDIAFCGYVTELAHWQSKILELSGQAVRIESEAELIGYIIAHHQLSLLAACNGYFAAAVYDRQAAVLHLVSDRLGFRPLFVSTSGGQVAFASEVKALAALTGSRTIDREALEDILTFNFLCDDRTLYSDIVRLQPATVLTLQPGASPRSHVYWTHDQWKENQSLTIDDYLDGQIEVLDRAMRRLLPLADNRPVCFLSSGCDSRRVLLQMLAVGGRPTLCTTSVQLGNSTSESDTEVSKALAGEFGLPRYWSDLYDPDSDFTLARLAFRMADGETTQHRWILPLLSQLPIDPGLNFDGQGGDVLVYDSQINAEALKIVGQPDRQAAYVRHLFSGAGAGYVIGSDDEAAVLRRLKQQISGAVQNNNWYTSWIERHWARRRTAPFSQQILRYKLETVYPFLDHEVTEFSLSLPWSAKIGRHLQHEVLMKINAALMHRLPTDSGAISHDESKAAQSRLARPIPADYRARKRLAFSKGTARLLADFPELRARLSIGAKAAAALLGAGPLVRLMPNLSKFLWRLEGIGFYLLAQEQVVRPDAAAATDKAIADFLFGKILPPISPTRD